MSSHEMIQAQPAVDNQAPIVASQLSQSNNMQSPFTDLSYDIHLLLIEAVDIDDFNNYSMVCKTIYTLAAKRRAKHLQLQKFKSLMVESIHPFRRGNVVFKPQQNNFFHLLRDNSGVEDHVRELTISENMAWQQGGYYPDEECHESVEFVRQQSLMSASETPAEFEHRTGMRSFASVYCFLLAKLHRVTSLTLKTAGNIDRSLQMLLFGGEQDSIADGLPPWDVLEKKNKAVGWISTFLPNLTEIKLTNLWLESSPMTLLPFLYLQSLERIEIENCSRILLANALPSEEQKWRNLCPSTSGLKSILVHDCSMCEDDIDIIRATKNLQTFSYRHKQRNPGSSMNFIHGDIFNALGESCGHSLVYLHIKMQAYHANFSFVSFQNFKVLKELTIDMDNMLDRHPYLPRSVNNVGETYPKKLADLLPQSLVGVHFFVYDRPEDVAKLFSGFGTEGKERLKNLRGVAFTIYTQTYIENSVLEELENASFFITQWHETHPWHQQDDFMHARFCGFTNMEDHIEGARSDNARVPHVTEDEE